MTKCYCGNHDSFQNCCELYLKGIKKPQTVEALMRSRYSAYATQNADYLVATTHISSRKFHKKSAILDWSKSNQWIKLEILTSSETTVTFNAYYLDSQLKAQIHYEHSTFIFKNESWFYVEGNY
jgi:SEC-C motif domain protein